MQAAHYNMAFARVCTVSLKIVGTMREEWPHGIYAQDDFQRRIRFRGWTALCVPSSFLICCTFRESLVLSYFLN